MRSFLDIAIGTDLSKYPNSFKKWEDLAKNIPILIKLGTIKAAIMDLPELNLKELCEDIGSFQRIYTVTTFIAHAYIRSEQGLTVRKKDKKVHTLN